MSVKSGVIRRPRRIYANAIASEAGGRGEGVAGVEPETGVARESPGKTRGPTERVHTGYHHVTGEWRHDSRLMCVMASAYPESVHPGGGRSREKWVLMSINKQSKVELGGFNKKGRTYGGGPPCEAEAGGEMERGGGPFEFVRKLKPGIEEYEFLGSPASTLCRTRRRPRKYGLSAIDINGCEFMS